ncbi:MULTISPECIES: hypothetical protein [unclassified Ensifer]|uniref:hypothetical protein n=1 Tax=unclassified Ensifer TaxID=2633371 RepID=UPI0008139BAC|nr:MULTISPECIES: hypothetical protein [unclassified Ensifer]OCP09370.1 hypothetical protein BC374_02060 [Ensifer sp. LC13]OCP10549.1 hypothetical protein BBX50_02410 [Ensifer sp. LC11]OCP11695.1 hypothetical protein BC362_07275 [Ensifer sp. LC14]OCP32618.1 hypothetical protein BC364_02060 [Ensifer sp. LC499]
MLHPQVRFSPSNIAALKKSLRDHYPHIKSSHFDEAIAASLGFKSYAALRPALLQVGSHARLIVVTDHMLLLLRLEELGYRDIDAGNLRQLMWSIAFPDSWYDHHLEKAVTKRRRPTAANSQ